MDVYLACQSPVLFMAARPIKKTGAVLATPVHNIIVTI